MLGGGGNTVKEWEILDEQINRYPMIRTFSAIGSGQTFRELMVSAISASTGRQIQPDDVTETPSSKGKYTSVRIDVMVNSPEEVKEIFQRIKSNPDLKWCM